MKLALSALMFSLLLTSCGHMKKDKPTKETNSSQVSFIEDDVAYEAQVQLPNESTDKLPLVVIVHEWWGRTPYLMNRADMLNREGFATMAVDLYGNNKTVETPTEAQVMATPFYQDPEMGVARLNKYIELAKENPRVDPEKIYVIGYCFGGTQALNLARSGADVKGVVSFHGGLTTTMKSEGIKAEVLAINGLADPMVPAKDRSQFEKEMKGLKANYRMINYQGATHAFTNPKATEVGQKYGLPLAYNKVADEASWNELLTFLRK